MKFSTVLKNLRRNSAFPTEMKIFFLLTVSIVLLTASCGRKFTVSEITRETDFYIARAALGWQRLLVFRMTGQARLTGTNLVSRGRFILWGDRNRELIRADFFGPDGRPVLSIRGDSLGFSIYYPREEQAIYSPGGFPLGSGIISSSDFLFAARTGFPLNLEQWIIDLGKNITESELTQWFLTSGADTMCVEYRCGFLFPRKWITGEGSIEIRSSTPGNEFDSWPAIWILETESMEAEIEIIEIRSPVEDWPELWDLSIPVVIDTLDYLPDWKTTWLIPER